VSQQFLVARKGGPIMGKYGPSGGGGGIPNSGFTMAVDEEIAEVVVHIGHREGATPEIIVAIDFVSRQGQIHRFRGDAAADEHFSFPLDSGDVIRKITGLTGDRPIHIKVWLQSGRVSDPLGAALGTAVHPYEYDTGNQKIVGLWGRTGAWIDAIGVYTA
jgi:hypothetical protein